MEKQFGAFEVAGVKYCINIMDIKKVVREQSLTKIPNFPSFVEGMINLNGKVIPVLSIDKKLEYHSVLQDQDVATKQEDLLENDMLDEQFVRSSANNTSFKLLIIQIEQTLVGLLVDKLDQIITVNDQDLQNVYEIGESHDVKMISGVLHINEEIYYTINVLGILEGIEKELLDFISK
ncbi:MAG: chemotaxis protein CheW [Brevinema sp.]